MSYYVAAVIAAATIVVLHSFVRMPREESGLGDFQLPFTELTVQESAFSDETGIKLLCQCKVLCIASVSITEGRG